jgi:hypothetical protein
VRQQWLIDPAYNTGHSWRIIRHVVRPASRKSAHHPTGSQLQDRKPIHEAWSACTKSDVIFCRQGVQMMLLRPFSQRDFAKFALLLVNCAAASLSTIENILFVTRNRYK